MGNYSVAILAALLLSSQVAGAFSGFLNTWRNTYPSSTTSAGGGNCAVCHQRTSGGNPWNAYGWAVRTEYLAGGRTDIVAAFLAVEDADSDGNGDSNLSEINANTLPGWTEGPNNTYFFKNGTTSDNNLPISQGTPDPVDAVAQWLASFNLSGEDAEESADPDQDRATNLEEYLFGGIPNDSQSFPALEVDPNGGDNPSFTIDVRVDDPNVTIAPMWSRNLVDFFDTDFTTTSDANSSFGPSYVRRTYNTSLSSESALFFRLESP